MNRSTQSTLAIVILLLGGYAAWQMILEMEPQLPSAPPRDVGPPRVTFEALVPRDLSLEVLAFGNLEASREVSLTSEVSGRIVEVHADWRPGAYVEAGELLVRLDESLYALDVQSAEANLGEAQAAVGVVRVEQRRARVDQDKLAEALDLAQRQYERMVDLGQVTSDLQRDTTLSNKLNAERALELAKGTLATSEASLVSALARVASAEAGVARATELRSRCTLRAPFSGQLRGHAPGLGTLASPGLVLAQLVDPNSMLLALRVPERDLLLIKTGMSAHLVFPNTPETDAGAIWAGVVSAVDVASNPLTRRGLVEIELEQESQAVPRADLPAGLFARAVIEVQHLKNALWIDRSHIRWEGADPVAYVVGHAQAGPEEPVAERRVLKLWREHGEGFLVSEGLALGERLITGPLDRMAAGVPVIFAAGTQRANSSGGWER